MIKPVFDKKYNVVSVQQYVQMKRKKLEDFLKSIKDMDADYIYVRDINDAPCVTAKKREIQNKINNADNNRIIVVIKEIESWYLAGLNETNSKRFGIPNFDTTDNITKAKFNSFIPRNFDSGIDFKLEILKCFSINMAKQKNKSFRYFLEKYDC